MKLSERIDQLLAGPHQQLRAGIEATDPTIAALWSLPPKRATPMPQPQRRWGPGSTPEPAPARSSSARPLQEAWSAFVQPLRAHMERERRVLIPLARRVADGETRWRAELGLLTSQAMAEHDELRRLGALLRGEAMFAEPVKRAVFDVLERFEEHTRIEDLEIYPAALAGSATLTPVAADARYRTADDVLRSLRAGRPDGADPTDPTDPAEEIDDTDADSGLLDRLRRLFG